LGYSLGLGSLVSYSYAYWWYSKYIEVIDQSYTIVKSRFADDPEIMERAESEGMSSRVVKNFGLSAWNDNDTEDDFAFDEAHAPVMKDAMEGTLEQEAKERKAEVLSHIYGQ